MNRRFVWNFEINNDRPLQFPAVQLHESSDMRWEARFFWPDDSMITLHGLEASFLDLSRYQVTHRQDTYCLLPAYHYNLKIRREQLLYKPILERTPQALAYGKKINIAEQPPNVALVGMDGMDADALLAQIKRHGRSINVAKEALIYRFETTPKTKLELAKLHIGNATYFSVNIESHARCLVESITQQILDPRMPCDYISFLKTLDT